MNDKLVWIDCEMTGLKVGTDELIEVAALVTDGQLNVLGDGVDVIIKPSDTALAQMGDFVREMHTNSGLLNELGDGVSLATAEQLVLDYVKEFIPEPKTAPLAGNSIGTDRAFLSAQMPQLEGFVHYRNVDVSSIKELCRRWMPDVLRYAPAKNGGHRALKDIQESIEELRYYREAAFCTPGLQPAQLKQIAAKYQGSLTGFGPEAGS